jgi:putative transposase
LEIQVSSKLWVTEVSRTMSRKPRIHFPGAFYHALNRGNRRELVYWDNADYREMLDGLAEAGQHYDVLVHGYCLMPNHFHLLVEVGEKPLAGWMKSTEGRYARYFNRRYRKVGHVFQGRYHAILCDKSAYLLELVRYIHLNPVRAGLVQDPADWPWSSHRSYLGLEDGSAWLTKRDVLSYFGQSGAGGLVVFLSQAWDLEKHPEYYRTESFPVLDRGTGAERVPKEQEPRRWRSSGYTGRRLSLDQLARAVAEWAGIEIGELCSRSEARGLVHARDWLVYVASNIFFYPNQKLARFLNRTASAISCSHKRAALLANAHPDTFNSLCKYLLRC